MNKVEATESISNQLNLQIVRLAWCCDVFYSVVTVGTDHQNAVNIKFIPNIYRWANKNLFIIIIL